jgi:hypothetical protein
VININSVRNFATPIQKPGINILLIGITVGTVAGVLDVTKLQQKAKQKNRRL